MSEEMISLAELADIDVSEIDEVRFEILPVGQYGFEVVKAELDSRGEGDDRKVFANFDLKVISVENLVDSNTKPESLIGRSYSEKIYINADDPQKSIGRIRAFVADIGCDNAGKLGEILAGCVGQRFESKLIHRKSKQDPDVIFTSLRLEPAKTAEAV